MSDVVAGEAPPTSSSSLPEDETLVRAKAAFGVGDYVQVREICREQVLRGGPVGDEARDLLRRVGVDPVQVAVVLLCAGLLAGIVWHYV